MWFKKNKYVTREDLAKEVNRILDQRRAKEDLLHKLQEIEDNERSKDNLVERVVESLSNALRQARAKGSRQG